MPLYYYIGLPFGVGIEMKIVAPDMMWLLATACPNCIISNESSTPYLSMFSSMRFLCCGLSSISGE